MNATAPPNFTERLTATVAERNSLVCVGLDPSLNQPAESPAQLTDWGVSLISATHTEVCAYKFNLAFYEAQGSPGIQALEATLAHLAAHHPDIITIGDAKRGDIGSTSEAHARYLLDHLGFDAVTLNPYLGVDTMAPFLARADRGSIVVCRTTNPSADDFQLIDVNGQPLWQHILRTTAHDWNRDGNCLAVVGATRPADFTAARKIAGQDFFFLVPGVGAQGGNLAQTLDGGLSDAGGGLLISSSRGIAAAESPGDAARELRRQINQRRSS